MKRQIIMCCLFAVATGLRAAITAPVDIPGCVLWLDAADTSTYDGSPVAQWRDKSGLGHHMAQSDAGKRPTVSAAALNNQNVLALNGTQWLSGSPVLQQGSTNFSFFGVWNSTKKADSVLFEQHGSTLITGTRCAVMATSSGTYGFSGYFVDLFSMPYATNTWKVSGVEYDGRVENSLCFWDSTSTYSGQQKGKVQIGASAVKIGANLSGGEILNGSLAEIVVYEGELTEIDRNQILYYLQTKWGVGETYKDIASIIDFSHGSFPPEWIATGEAFSTNQPTYPTLVNTFNNTGYFIDTWGGGARPKNDNQTGSLTGNEFVLSNNTVRLRVGGGYHDACQVRLERKTAPDTWEILRRASGRSQNWMDETRWNVGNLIGQTVRFAAIDNVTTTWGCIRFDDIRLLDEPAPADFTCLFSEATLPSYLLQHKPYGTPLIEVTSNNTLRLGCPGTYNAWNTLDQTPKVLFQTFAPASFVLQTHVTAFSYQGNAYSHAGLALLYESAGANTYDYLLFGPFGLSGKVRVERTGVGTIGNEWVGNITNVHLRVTGAKGKLTFLCSQEGTNWTTIASTDVMKSKALLNAGLFEKTWVNGMINATTEFASLSYQSTTTNSPAGVPGCVLWLDADDASSIVAGAAGHVLQWRDKSGMGNHVAQTTEAAQPAVMPATLNSRTTLNFDGGDSLAGPPVWQQGETTFTMFAVWKRTSASGSQVIVEQAGAGNGARASLITVPAGTYGFVGEYNDAYTSVPYTLNAWNLSGLEYSGLTSANIYFDAAGASTAATIDGTYKENVGVTGLRVGCKLTNGGELLKGDVAEILMFNRLLTAAERYNVLYYLQQKWQIGSSYYGNPSDIPAGALSVSDKRVNLHGRTETYAALNLAEGSVVTNGSLVCTGTIASTGAAQVNGGLTLADGVVVAVNAQTGCIDVNGTLAIGGGATVALSLPEGSRAIQTTLFRFDTLFGEGNLAAWQVEGIPTSWKTRLFVTENNSIVLKAALSGTIIVIQ